MAPLLNAYYDSATRVQHDRCSLRWVLRLTQQWRCAQGPDVFPIPGTRRSDRLQENVEAFALSQKLTKQDLDELEACCPVNAAVGDRSVTLLPRSTRGRQAGRAALPLLSRLLRPNDVASPLHPQQFIRFGTRVRSQSLVQIAFSLQG